MESVWRRARAGAGAPVAGGHAEPGGAAWHGREARTGNRRGDATDDGAGTFRGPGGLTSWPAPQLPPASRRQHLAVALAGELAGEFGMYAHGPVLPVVAGRLPRPSQAGSLARAYAGQGAAYPFCRHGGGRVEVPTGASGCRRSTSRTSVGLEVAPAALCAAFRMDLASWRNGPTLSLSDRRSGFSGKQQLDANYCTTWTCTDDGAVRER